MNTTETSEKKETRLARILKVNPAISPKLALAIINNLDRDTTRDVAQHGADAGFAGFTYTADTVKFAQQHRRDIVQLVEALADELPSIAGTKGPITFVSQFRCMAAVDEDHREKSIAMALYGVIPHDPFRDHNLAHTLNALAWFALEEVSRAEHFNDE